MCRVSSTIIFLVAALNTAASTANAQSGSAQGAHELRGWGAGYLAAGRSSISTSGLNERLSSLGYPAFGRGTGMLGIGAYVILPRGVMLGGEATGLIVGEQKHGERRVGMDGGVATLGIGYTFEVSPRLRIYPRVGVGAGGLAMWFNLDTDPVEFDDVLSDPDRHLEESRRLPALSVDGAVLDIGAGAEFWPARKGLLVGLRVGYLAAPSDWSWVLDGRTVNDGPSATVAGPYARVVIGAGPWW